MIYKTIIISAVYFSLIFLPAAAESAEDQAISRIYYQAEELYAIGKYEQAVSKLEEILKTRPDHEDTSVLMKECRKKIDLTSGLLNEALRSYIEGNPVSALEKLNVAFSRDNKNYQVNKLLVKILTELGEGQKNAKNYSESRKYLNKALEISPDNEKAKTIFEEVNRELSKKAKTVEVPAKEKNVEKKKLPVQKINETKKKEQPIIDQKKEEELLRKIEHVEKEKEGLLRKLEEKEKIITQVTEKNMEQERGPGVSSWYRIIAFIMLAISGLTVLWLFVFGRYPFRRIRDFKSYDKIDTEFEKKMKKLEIIESKFAGEDPYENQVALNMLEEFVHDPDYRVKLVMVKILHKISPEIAVGIAGRMIKREKGSFKSAACRLLGELVSPESIDLQLALLESEDKDIRKSAKYSLSRMLASSRIDEETKKIIKMRIDEADASGDWIV
ncbi:MAG: hypothetical protein ABIH89_06865 [Elusimicrobiota bacterium]